jgi:pimeloyl-ACP methyl ester carboxylesterase
MANLIPDAGLVVYEGVGHFSYVEQPAKTIAIINSFVGGR